MKETPSQPMTRSELNMIEYPMKTKLMATHLAILLVGSIVGFIVSGCVGTRIERLSGQEFLNQADQISRLNSFHWTSYVGSSSGRAYLEFGYPTPFGKGTRTTVYWTFLSELPEDIALKLKAGNPPWTPWQPETNRTERLMLPAVP